MMLMVNGEIRGQFLQEKSYICDVIVFVLLYNCVIQRLYYYTIAVCFREDRGFLNCFFVWQEGSPCLLSNF